MTPELLFVVTIPVSSSPDTRLSWWWRSRTDAEHMAESLEYTHGISAEVTTMPLVADMTFTGTFGNLHVTKAPSL